MTGPASPPGERRCETCVGPLAPNKAPGTARRFCSERCRKRQYDQACVDCGARVSGTDRGRRPDPAEPRCRRCAANHRVVWTREAIIAAVQAWAAGHGGEPPAAVDWRRGARGDGRVCPTSIVEARFGSWNAAITAAGFQPRPSGHRRGRHG